MNDWPLLSLLIWLPMVGGIVVMFLREQAALARWVSLAVTVVAFLLSLQLWAGFDSQTATMQFVEQMQWISAIDARYHLGIDGIALPLILLTTLVMVLVVLAGWHVDRRLEQYMAAFLILEGFMVGVFCALDALLFYVFFEGMLIPMFLIIGIWGGPNRVYATLKFFLYTFFGSVFMLVGLIYLYLKTGSWSLAEWYVQPLSLTEQVWLFLAFLLAFAVKIPMWPVHTWLPDAHVEAPTAGSVVLAAVMLKIGGFGFLRFSLPVTPDAAQELSWLMIGLSLVAVVYVGLVALVQADMKKLIAYSSISHMGFVTLGIFVLLKSVHEPARLDAIKLAMDGAVVQMISHGFVSAAMFLGVGVLYDRMHTRRIRDYGGVAQVMPWFTLFAVFFAMANAGLPGTSGFVGEFMVILASFQADFWLAFLAATTLVLGAAYTLWMVKRVMFGEITNPEVNKLQDINSREGLMLTVLAGLVLVIGVWPDPLLEMMDVSVSHLIELAARSKLG